MARILLAWELGANLGHVMRMRALAQELLGRGHECVFAVRDLAGIEGLIGASLGPVLQAPLLLGRVRSPLKTQVSYASLLHNSGFDEPAGLAARLRAWRELMQGHRIQALICDHSPTALLAARSLSLPRALLGTGFTVPPVRQPFPVFQPALKVAPKLLAHNEAAVLTAANQALERLRLNPLERLQALFDGSRCEVLSYPELDHYEGPRQEPYRGLPVVAQGVAPQWPEGGGPRILAYLRPFKDLQATLSALSRSKARVLLRVGDIPPARLKAFLRPGLVITDQVLDMERAAQDCDAYVNYASHGLSGEMLLAGKPGLLFPDVLERALVARRVLQLGAGLAPPAEGKFNLSEALRRIVEDPSLRKPAEAFAARYRGQDRKTILPGLVSGHIAAFGLT